MTRVEAVIFPVAGGWQFRIRPRQADELKAAFGGATTGADITEGEMIGLVSIAYHQPVTRGALSHMLGSEVSRDVIGHLRRLDMIASGPRSPQPGAPTDDCLASSMHRIRCVTVLQS